jgi:DNA-binding Lrp family transcriptional regulator
MRLSERTVRTALDRLEAEGIIRTCDPVIIAAKIKRADQRPQGWDLAMHLVRDDLNDEDLLALERQFPGLTARVVAMRTNRGFSSARPWGARIRARRSAATPRPSDVAARVVAPMRRQAWLCGGLDLG